jgi:hypothetical protein
MAEIIILLAGLSLLWLGYNLYRAKQYNKFLSWLDQEIKPQLIIKLKEELELSRNDLTPNNDCHIQATIHYWTSHKVRILEGALSREIIPASWLGNKLNYRMAQHLRHRQNQFSVGN